MANSSLSTLAEGEFFDLLARSVSGSDEGLKKKRIACLEELQKRAEYRSIRDIKRSIDILLDMAKKQGHNQPESSLIVDALSLIMTRDGDAFQRILSGLEGQGQEENLLFIVFSRLVLELEHDMKKQAIPPLLRFLMSRNSINDVGVTEVYDCLVSLGNEKLNAQIVDEVIPFLGSFEVCTVVFSARLSAKFADAKLLPDMLNVLRKSMKGYYDGHCTEIERDICEYLERVKDQQCLPDLLKLLKMRSKQGYTQISKAVARVLDDNAFRIDDVLDILYDEKHDREFIDAILQSFQEMKKARIDARKLFANIRINWWSEYPTAIHMHQLLVKNGEQSKPALFDILLQDDEKYDFALKCLNEIGITNQELATVFPQPLMLQIYDYFYKGKLPHGLNQIWDEKEKLREKVSCDTDKLEHLIFHIFAGFNFVSLNLVPLRLRSIDVVCFYPETLDLLIIGCTTGTLKDDLANMDAMIRRMKNEMAVSLGKCSITPIVAFSEISTVSSSDAQYSSQNNIIVLQRQDIDRLLEMLNTNRNGREAIKYIESCRFPQEVRSPY
jgi:hypothetical protein